MDGVEVFTRLIENADNAGVQGSRVRNVQVGAFIDFVIDLTEKLPRSESNGIFWAWEEGSQFSATLSMAPIPEPSTYLLFAIGILAIVGMGVRQRKEAT